MAELNRLRRFRIGGGWRRPLATGIGILSGGVAVFAMASSGGTGGGSDDSDGSRAPARAGPALVSNFPNARDEPPEGWTGRVFQLSQNYPASLPELGEAPWLQFDFRTQTVQYLDAVLAYALEGNVEVDFRGQDNAVRKWFHVPWLHGDMHKGREFIHGMTLERHSRPGELAPTQTSMAENWAVGMYNPRGGFVVGRVWANRDDPDPTLAVFPEGTVAFKLLFTAAPVDQVPFLHDSLEWEADIKRSRTLEPRPKLRLLQIDVAVRDSRADATTGWVFGTFIYNGDAPGDSVWKRMVPVGAMWGNDPDRLADHGPLQETVINPEARPLMQHLGHQGRLNGPVDNPRSSCSSCHSVAEIPADLSDESTPPVPPPDASRELMSSYFRNIPAATPFTAGQHSLDYSMQLQNGIANWARQTNLAFPAPPSLTGRQRRVLSASRREVRVSPAPRD